MDPGALVERIRRLPGADAIPNLDAFDPGNDLHVDGAALVLLARFHKLNEVDPLSLLFELSQPRLSEIARQITARFALAIDPDDLVASFFTRLFTDVRRPQPEVRHFLGLAHTSMRNDALNQLRHHNRSMRRMIRFQAALRAPVDPAREVDDQEQIHHVSRIGLCLLAVVGECFHGLRERDRRVLLAREVQGMSYDEVSQLLSLPPNQVGAVIKRARHRLADRIATILAAGVDEST